MKYAKYITLALLAIGFAACEKDEIEGTIFIDPVENPDTYTYEFDQWLKRNFTDTYNVEFIYKLDDNSTDPNYNVVPVRLGMADTLAHLSLYLWYDAYKTVVGPNFLVQYGPKMIQLIGSALINAAQGTEKLGYAEGGIKITLTKINSLDTAKVDEMNEEIFKTMHHEFSHILHQQKTYPKEFETITPADYDPSGWQYREDDNEPDLWKREHFAWEMGYVSCYGSSEAHEDFVETIANYIVQPDENWQYMMDHAGKKGATAIQRKLDMCRTWLKEQYNYDLDAMHVEVQKRQNNLDWNMIMHMYK
ncbi:MAG: putative zinc-binding metallopeptidase [Paludibacteraceae bacterium]|nr:putative zinc-binding metallopeptidase [Paludibacteraceae bacterium]